jgi:hypothetical protein
MLNVFDDGDGESYNSFFLLGVFILPSSLSKSSSSNDENESLFYYYVYYTYLTSFL